MRFTTVTALANDLLAARDDHSLTRVMRRWRAIPLVILDELGFVPLSRDGAQVLLQFVSDRYDHGRSVIVTTNLEFSRWTEVFHDAQMTAALLDRLTHRCHIIEHTGESYRFRESLQRQAAQV
ncbi:MAG: ATP-binding protein [Chloroflexi bacterium]|nr:ATP-binding protein [Chloroflexota bacterium]